MGSTRPTRPMWIGLDLCDRSDWVEFFLTHHGELGKKIPSTQSDPCTPLFETLTSSFCQINRDSSVPVTPGQAGA